MRALFGPGKSKGPAIACTRVSLDQEGYAYSEELYTTSRFKGMEVYTSLEEMDVDGEVLSAPADTFLTRHLESMSEIIHCFWKDAENGLGDSSAFRKFNIDTLYAVIPELSSELDVDEGSFAGTIWRVGSPRNPRETKLFGLDSAGQVCKVINPDFLIQEEQRKPTDTDLSAPILAPNHTYHHALHQKYFELALLSGRNKLVDIRPFLSNAFLSNHRNHGSEYFYKDNKEVLKTKVRASNLSGPRATPAGAVVAPVPETPRAVSKTPHEASALEPKTPHATLVGFGFEGDDAAALSPEGATPDGMTREEWRDVQIRRLQQRCLTVEKKNQTLSDSNRNLSEAVLVGARIHS
jgi:hypothetical protein